jgi:hypothetical protein
MRSARAQAVQVRPAIATWPAWYMRRLVAVLGANKTRVTGSVESVGACKRVEI